jgi:tetratricopeptide (TPR) repeat protein
MTRRLRILFRAAAFAALGLVAAGVPSAVAQQRGAGASQTLPSESASSGEPKTKEQLEAQQHFQRAKDLYQTGAYREAIAELEQARALDPKGKDLVFNLGIVTEKLGKFDDAIGYFRQYIEMPDVSAAERAKAENIIKRIEGAKREVTTVPAASASAGPEPPKEGKRGRIDAATITAASVGVVGLGIGTVFGILAISNKPPSSFVSGRDGSYQQYQDIQSKSDSAHSQGIVSDVGFAVGIVGLAVATYLYFARTKEPRTVGFTPAAAPHLFGGSFQ